LKHCTAPCIGNVTREDYLAQVRAGIEFLQGQADELRSELELEMKRAAAALEFEKAAQLRDALEDLKRTTQKTEKFERVPYKLPLSINPEVDLRELARLLGLANPPARIEGFDISNISGTFMVASMVSFWQGRPDRANYRRFKMKTVTQQNDFACMAETSAAALHAAETGSNRHGAQPRIAPKRSLPRLQMNPSKNWPLSPGLRARCWMNCRRHGCRRQGLAPSCRI